MLRVWDVLSGKQLQQIPTGEGTIYCAAALWGDRVVTGHEMREIRLWSLSGGGSAAGVLQGHTGSVSSLAVVGGGKAQGLLASAGRNDGSVRLWDVDAGTCTAVLNGHTDSVWCLADMGGGRLLSGSLDRSLRVWNTATGACLAVVPNAHGAGARGAFRAACALLGGAATGSLGGSVQRWKWDEGTGALMPDGAALQLEGIPMLSLAAAQGPDGALQLLACYDHTLRVLNSFGPCGVLRIHAELTGHSAVIHTLVVMRS